MGFDVEEYRKNRKNQQKEETEEKKEQGFDVEKYRKSRYAPKVGEEIVTRVNTWLKDNEDFINSYNSRYGVTALSYRADSSDWLSNVTSRTSDFGKEAESIKSLLSQYSDFYDAEWVKSISEALDSTLAIHNDIISNSTKDHEYWSQWKDEDAYKKDMADWLDDKAELSEDKVAQRQAIYKSNTARIEELKEANEIVKKLKNREKLIRDNIIIMGRGLDESAIKNAIDSDGYIKFLREQLEGYGGADAVIKESESLKAENTIYEREQGRLDGYFVPETEEFLKNAADRDYRNPTMEELDQYSVARGDTDLIIANGWRYKDGELRDKNGNVIKIDQNMQEPVFQDKLAFYFNNRDGNDEGVISTYAFNAVFDIISEGRNGSWDQLKDNEINIYYNLLKTEGQEAAYRFLDAMKPTLNKRATQEMADKVSKAELFSLEQMFYNVASIPANIFGGVPAFIDDAINIVQGKDINPYSSAHRWQNFAQAVRQDTAQDIIDATGGAALPYVGTTWGDVYQALMSGADSFVGIGLGVSAYGVLMGMGAASSKAKELYEKGASMGQIAAGSILAGAAEMVFEKASIDHFVKMGDTKSLKTFIINILKQGGVEASEETLTEIANTLSDAIVMGTQSDWQGYVDQYVEQGYSESEAMVKALFNDVGANVMNAAIGGFISGGGMGSLGSLGSYGKYMGQVKKHGQGIIEKGGVDTLKALALEMAGVKDSPNAKSIGKLASAVDSKASAKNVGKLSAAIGETVSTQNVTDVQNALTEKGLSKSEAKRVATYLTSSETLTAEQQSEIKDNEKIAEVVKELVNDPKSTLNQRKLNVLAARLGVDTKNSTINAKSTAVGDVSLKNDVDVSEKVSKEGKTIKVSTGEAITIDKNNAIAKTKIVDGERVVYYNTDHGLVELTDVTYASQGDGLLFEAFSDMNPAFANAVIKNYDNSVPVQTYIDGMREGIVLYGMHNFQAVGKDISRNSNLAELSESDQAFALKLGRAYAKSQVKKSDNALKTAIKNAAEKAEADGKSLGTSKKKVSVRFESGVNGGKLNRTQRRTVSLAKYLAKAIGIDIVFYDAMTTKNKKGEEANGYFDPKDNSIHLDLQNAVSDSKTIAFTLSHELVHFIKKWSPAKFNTFANFLMEQYAAHGVSTSTLLANKMAALGTTDADLAYEEMIADACERMLLDSNAVVKLMELRKSDLELFEKIKLHVLELLNKIRDAFKGVDPNTEEGIALQKMDDVLGKIHEMFEDAAVDAAKTYQEAQANAAELVFGESTVSEGKYDTSVKNQLKDSAKIGNASIAYNEKHRNVNAAVLKVGVDTMIEMAETMMPYLEQDGILPPDIPGKTIFKNGSYGRTGENTTLCVRTLTYEDFKDRVSDELGRPLTVAESLLVSQKIYDIATDPQCIYCYVAADRKAYDEYLGEYHKAMDKYIKAMRDGGDVEALYEEYLDGRKDTAAQQKRWAMWKSIANSGKDYISAKDLSTRANRDKIISAKGDFATQVKDAQRYAQSASWAKTVFDYRAYKGDILKLTQSLVDTLNSEYGLRMYSFSDYTPAFIVENMQMIIDASTRGLKSLAYTKDTAYAKIFAPTGQAINVSCFAKYDSKTGDYVEDNRQGASWADTKQLRDKFHNIGAVMVCTNDAMVEWAMRQDWVDVVIPYHIVKTGTTIANEYAWRNYTAESSDHAGGRTANVYPTEHNNDFATYQKLIEERGITPRFNRFYQRALNADFTKEQYMKLVNEVRLPASELSAVVPMFDLAEAKKSFGVDEDGNVIEGGFVDKGGYMGGWYRAGVDVNQEVLAVKKDIEDGRSSLNVDYGMNKLIKEKQSDSYGIKKQAKINPSNPYNGKTMYIDSDIYDYSFLTSLDDMKIESLPPLSDVKENGKISRNKAVELGLENAKSIGKQVDGEQYAIKNAYTEREIILGKHGLHHSLDGSTIHRLRTNARLSTIGASIVQNAVPINGLKKENQQANGTYAMACLVNDGDGYVVAIVTVDEFDSTVVGIDCVDITHSINGRFLTKKEDSRSSTGEQELGASSLSTTTISKISIAHFLEIVNSSHRSILSDDVLHHFDEERPSEGHYTNKVLFQKKTTTNRTLLANALESAAQNDIERNKITQYKEKIALIESEQAKLAEVRAKANELRFTKGRTSDETKQMKALDFEANQIANRINTYDRQLLNLESTTALKNVLQREKELARKKAEQKGKDALAAYKEKSANTMRELMNRYQDARKKGIESRSKTEMRHKIKGVVSDLNTLLLNPTKDKHIPIGLQKPVAAALDIINMDTVGAEERIAKYDALIAKEKNPDVIESLKQTRDRIAMQGENLSDKLTALKAAYADIKNSDDPLVKNSHNEAIEDLIENTIDKVGKTALRDMSLEQLETAYNMYKAILATVRNANKMFKEGRQETVTENSEAVKTEVNEAGGHRDRVLKATKFLKKFGWNMLKPIYAMKLIGSDTFTKLYENVRKGEDTWAVDVDEAKEFFQDKRKKYNYDSWDFKKQYSFEDSGGNSFSLSLEQIMSLYAYSKREQADRHLEVGGFIFDDAIEATEKNKLGIPMKYEVNDANPYRLGMEHLGAIIGILDTDLKDVKGFVDEMQAYLSDVMGAKGNEVSLAMYDIKLYNESHYFPLKTAKYFREFDPEKNGTPKIRNSGFSKKTVPKAGNPIVLSSFMDVWATHVNDMSMYHAFVLPLEDFMRVYNYSSTAGGYDSVQQYIKNAYGAQANTYIETLMNDLNGGARTDPATDLIGKGMSLFKKSAVFASASVVIQQPSAMARAFAYIDPKYFVDKPTRTKHKETWGEVKKYAPVAIIKEMGYFDTNMGRSTVDWIRDEKNLMDKIDDVASKTSALADELTWCAIWKAVKREIAATTNFKVGSEEFLKAAGKRFTDVVTKTQVYDSVLSRSALMRSKDTGAKMVTAFMAEPTTSLNMVVDAIIEGKRGNKKFAGKAVGAVAASIILNSILVSLVTAARDDDDDETYAEKYLESLTAELLDGFNPLAYIPLIKDIWSIMQGYDIERSDMSIWSDLWQSVENLFSDNKSGFEKTEGIVGSIASIFGLPAKNLMRDARALYNLTTTLLSGTPTTKAGVGDAIRGAIKSSIPLYSRIEKWVGADRSKSDNLYNAIMNGDEAHIERLKSGYKDETAINTVIRTGLRENDSRIKEAAQARIDGDISKYTRIVQEIIAEGNFVQDIIVGAVNAEINAIKSKADEQDEATDKEDESEKATSIYRGSDVNAAFESGDTTLAKEIISELMNVMTENNLAKARKKAVDDEKTFNEKKAREEAETSAKSTVKSSMTSYWKPLYKAAYKAGNTKEMRRIRLILKASGIYGTTSDILDTCKAWLKDK